MRGSTTARRHLRRQVCSAAARRRSRRPSESLARGRSALWMGPSSPPASRPRARLSYPAPSPAACRPRSPPASFLGAAPNHAFPRQPLPKALPRRGEGKAPRKTGQGGGSRPFQGDQLSQHSGGSEGASERRGGRCAHRHKDNKRRSKARSFPRSSANRGERESSCYSHRSHPSHLSFDFLFEEIRGKIGQYKTPFLRKLPCHRKAAS